MICFDTWNHIFWHHSTRMSLIFQFFASGWSLISLSLTKTLHWVSAHNRSVYNLDRDAFIAQIGGVSSNSYSSQISLLSTQCLLRNYFHPKSMTKLRISLYSVTLLSRFIVTIVIKSKFRIRTTITFRKKRKRVRYYFWQLKFTFNKYHKNIKDWFCMLNSDCESKD